MAHNNEQNTGVLQILQHMQNVGHALLGGTGKSRWCFLT